MCYQDQNTTIPLKVDSLNKSRDFFLEESKTKKLIFNITKSESRKQFLIHLT